MSIFKREQIRYGPFLRKGLSPFAQSTTAYVAYLGLKLAAIRQA